MKKIILTNGGHTTIDDKDFDWLNQWKWYRGARGHYAVRKQNHKIIRMHNLINKVPKGMEIDHIDRDTLNNRRANLRIVTHSQNMFNQGFSKNNSSGYVGISWHKWTKKWRAYISLKNKQIHLGVFSSLEKARLARKLAKIKFHTIKL